MTAAVTTRTVTTATTMTGTEIGTTTAIGTTTVDQSGASITGTAIQCLPRLQTIGCRVPTPEHQPSITSPCPTYLARERAELRLQTTGRRVPTPEQPPSIISPYPKLAPRTRRLSSPAALNADTSLAADMKQGHGSQPCPYFSVYVDLPGVPLLDVTSYAREYRSWRIAGAVRDQLVQRDFSARTIPDIPILKQAKAEYAKLHKGTNTPLL
jgi:hypothetical protein